MDAVAMALRIEEPSPTDTQSDNPSNRTTHDTSRGAADLLSTSPLLRLPRELRDVIYEYYFTEPDGLVYDHKTNALTRSNGDRIDLELMYTCHAVAQETKGLALRINHLIFRTSFTEDLRERAGLFHATTGRLEPAKPIC
jgi:hypothetical protein